MDIEERFEQLIAFLGSHLPSPVDQRETADGALTFTGGEPPEVIALLTETSIVISEFAGVWETSFSFSARPRRVGVLKWRRLPETELLNAIAALIKGARASRLSKYQVCQYCGQNTAPEWMHDEGVCASCGEHHSGAIH
jgi:hypothetical protein